MCIHRSPPFIGEMQTHDYDTKEENKHCLLCTVVFAFPRMEIPVVRKKAAAGTGKILRETRNS